ncbi:MAG: O-antigen ligase family protein [Limisphaerales bacterium]|jgi:O-antigen ligase|nr:O-antigen ligase family protein [Verrucomicrobiota bacterium]
MRRSFLDHYARFWVIALGVCFLLVIRFLGIPVILENFDLSSPQIELLAQAASAQSSGELLGHNPSSFLWGAAVLALALAGIPLINRATLSFPKSIFLPALIWILCVGLSTLQTLDRQLSLPTAFHLFLCLVSFLAGYLILRGSFENQRPFLWILGAALLPVLLAAFQQHYSGLEAMRQNVFSLVPPENLPEDLLRRLNSKRVYGTLVYPNSLAGLLLLLLPPCLCALWELPARVPRLLRLLLVVTLGYMGLAALFWSGSKTAWLISVFLAIITLFIQTRFSLRYKILAAGLILCSGLILFGIVFADYFKRGATSVGARFDYWRAAALNIRANPLLGSGPGTFAIPYQESKNPESEMARLCHNDYLEQATDSGIVAALAYLAFIGGSFWRIWRRAGELSPLQFCLALGLSGFALQGFSDFSLYIPAIAWPFFLLLGASLSPPASNNISVRESTP